MEITIRKLQEADIDAVSAIERASFSMPWSSQAFLELIDRDYCLYLVALADGEIVGTAGLTRSFEVGNIDNVVIAEAFRGKGIGRQMLEKLLSMGEEWGIEDFTLEVRVSNAPAIGLYEKLGFVSEGIRPRFYEKPVEDAMIMWRRLVKTAGA